MTPADLLAVQDIHLASWRDAYAGALSDAFLGAPVKEEMARRWAQMPPSSDLVFVGEVDGAIVGFALVRMSDPDGPVLESLHVSADARGSGTGRALFMACVAELRARGCNTLGLMVFADNDRARSAYAKWGGAETAPYLSDVVGEKVMAVNVLWRDLRLIG